MGKSASSCPVPKNWAPTLPYLTTPSHSPNLSPANLASIRVPPSPSDPLPIIPKSHKPGPCLSVRITPITDPLHPAYKQSGLFAAVNLTPGTFILPYIGELHSSLPNASYDYSVSDYDLWLDREGDVAVDASRMGNEGRFVNDFRGVPGRSGAEKKAKPNAEFRVAWDERRGERVMGVFVLAEGKNKKGKGKGIGIGRGEEILVSYGRGFWGERRAELEGEGEGEGEVEKG